MNLDALVKRFQKKDIIAFENLYAMYWENICGVVFAIVQNKGLAEEITQDVFTKVWNNSDSYNPAKGRFFTWILKLARKSAMEEVRLRSNRNQKAYLPSKYFLKILDDKNNQAEIDVPGLKKLLNKLSPGCVEIISLLYFSGYSVKEVSEALELHFDALRNQNRKCISQLRENITLEWI